MHVPVEYKRPFIWLRRFTHRQGYGIHSPFAFHLITDVIYEHLPYYDYEDLKEQECALKSGKNKNLFPEGESLRLRRLLFRLYNYVHPKNIIFVGEESMALRYLKQACKQASLLNSDDGTGLIAPTGSFFSYIRYGLPINQLEQISNLYIDHSTSDSLLVIHGIRFNHEMHLFWEKLKEDPRVGITFDLYYVGLVFFDHSKIKQHYIVNF